MRFPSPILALAVATACTDSTAPVLQIGVEDELQATGFAAYIQSAFEAETKLRTAVQLGTAAEVASMAERGSIDVALLTSDEAVERLKDDGVAAQATAFAHEELVFIGPVEDQFRSHGSTDGVTFIKNVSRANYLYLKAKPGSAEADRHAALFVKSKDREEAGSFLPSPHSGVALVEAVVRRKAFGLVRRSGIVLAAERGIEPHRVYQDGHPDLVLRLWAVQVHQARTKRAGDKGLSAWLAGEAGAKIVGAFGKQRFGLPIYGVGVPARGQGARVPGVSRTK